jgi:dihydrofolate reductase
MGKIVYYVAVSIDGFIEDSDKSSDKFLHEPSIVDFYLNDLKNFDTTIMGRNTYENGYKYGMKPGQAAYPHMQHYIFSNSLTFKNPDRNVEVVVPDLKFLRELKDQKGSDIYLCGGGIFAGWLLDNELIDVLKLKLNPVIFGSGTRLFGSSAKSVFLDLKESLDFEKGFKILTYNIKY